MSVKTDELDVSITKELPVPNISQSLNVQKEDFVNYDKKNDEHKKPKTEIHKHINLYYDKTFLKNYFDI